MHTCTPKNSLRPLDHLNAFTIKVIETKNVIVIVLISTAVSVAFQMLDCNDDMKEQWTMNDDGLILK